MAVQLLTYNKVSHGLRIPDAYTNLPASGPASTNLPARSPTLRTYPPVVQHIMQTGFTCEGSLRRAHLARARSLFAQHSNTRLGGETPEHTSIKPEFWLGRVPLAWARYSVAQNLGSSPKRDPRAHLTFSRILA
ncbi:hypothetical protein DEO72_LG4g844 [Vigna unguiculata]|uniref:Uncharacterized protein n=1 Tax=Vigna unguiculata TaxID=3917 RepID=A0A4D6LM68_VIGUN|nr:hypothetical protein DEO72_LG4g844 [Vigna unguiculata]